MSETKAPKVTLLPEHMWLIRCVAIKPGTTEMLSTTYMETPVMWNKSVPHATIFHSHEVCENMILCYEIMSKNMNPKYNPDAEMIDIVSWVDEMQHSLHAHRFEIRDGKIIRKDDK